MNIPIVEFPSKIIRDQLPPEDWIVYVNGTTELTEHWLSCGPEFFSNVIKSNHSVVPFLKSFFYELTDGFQDDSTIFSPYTSVLRQKCLLLSIRIFSYEVIPLSSLGLNYISQLCVLLKSKDSLIKLFQETIKRRLGEFENVLHESKIHVLCLLGSPQQDELRHLLRNLASIIHLFPRAGVIMITGSDLLDTIGESYEEVSPSVRRPLLGFVFLSLRSLIKTDEPNLSLLFDQLYSLANSAKSSPGAKRLMEEMLAMTPLKPMIKEIQHQQSIDRAANLLKHLQQFDKDVRSESMNAKKGKSKAMLSRDLIELENDNNAVQNPYRMSLASQVGDLFPNINTRIVLKLLENYHDDVEAVTAHILEAPDSLKDSGSTSGRVVPNVESLPLRPRINVHDGDALDTLSVDVSRLHQGRSRTDETADDLLSRPPEGRKAAALAALAAFDTDDDEHDDTYDTDDVRAPDAYNDLLPDSEHSSELSMNAELQLLEAYDHDRSVFQRDAATRRSNLRKKLCAKVKLSDEIIEGWALMLKREPDRLTYLRRRADERGFSEQRSLPRTAWRKVEDGNINGDLSDGQNAGQQNSTNNQPYRGSLNSQRGRSRPGRGNANDGSTQAARHRKEASKGSRANHNRRDQHLRKMARGGQ